jgi:hypothetical protein
MTGLARHLFLGTPAGAAAAGPLSRQGTGVPSGAASMVPPSREGSVHAGLPGPLEHHAAWEGGAPVSPRTAMVSLSEERLGGGPGLGGSAVSQPSPSTLAAAAADGAGRPLGVEGSVSGSESGRETPPLAAGGPRGLSVSTDGAEVPTLSQLVEGASPSWRPSSAADEASLDLLTLRGMPQGGHNEAAAASLLVGAASALEAAAQAGGGEQAAEPSEVAWQGVTIAPQEGEASLALAEQGQHQEGREQAQCGARGAVEPEGVVSAAAGAVSTGAVDGPVLPPPSPAMSPRAAEIKSVAAAVGDAPAPAPAQPQQGPQRAPQPQGRGPAVRRPPPSPQRSKLESFDKLISKPPNAIRQVRLTATPVPPPRGTSLTSWLPSPGRSKPAQPAPAPQPAQQQQQAQAAATAGHIAAALSNLSPTGGPRLFRSSSDSTLLSSLTEASEAGSVVGEPPARAPAGAAAGATAASRPMTTSAAEGAAAQGQGGTSASSGSTGSSIPRRVSFDAGAGGVGSVAAVGASASGSLLSHASMSAADLKQYTGRAIGALGASNGGGAGAARAPLVTPTGYLVVLDAWEGSAPATFPGAVAMPAPHEAAAGAGEGEACG